MSSELRTFAGAAGLVVAGLLASAMAAVWVLGTTAAVSSNDGPAFTYDDGLYLLWSMPEPSGSAEASATSPDGTTAPRLNGPPGTSMTRAVHLLPQAGYPEGLETRRTSARLATTCTPAFGVRAMTM